MVSDHAERAVPIYTYNSALSRRYLYIVIYDIYIMYRYTPYRYRDRCTDEVDVTAEMVTATATNDAFTIQYNIILYIIVSLWKMEECATRSDAKLHDDFPFVTYSRDGPHRKTASAYIS